MTLEQQLGQMIIAGVPGTLMDEETGRLITQYHVGGFILYKANLQTVDQTRALLNGLKESNRSASVPLFLSIDQEGGKVSRLPAPLIPLPSSREIAGGGSSSRALAVGEAIGQQLQAFGFNVNYAPVLDIDSNPQNPVIGSRSFGSTAALVSSFGIREMEGLRASGIIPVVKHFPGHGDTSVDSHLELPVVNKTLRELQELELVPFAQAVKSQADAVMIAHILLPEIDPDHPATMSQAVIAGLLRGRMGFDGVVITDDMTMGAILNHYDLGQAAVQSVQAGSDIVLVAHSSANAIMVLDMLKQAVASGVLSEERIGESVYRILTLKERYNLSDSPAGLVDVERINAAVREALEDSGG
jgi:beta-N-acetylhexosaminidase